MTGCFVEGCDRPHYGRGYCNSHWARTRRGHDLTPSFDRREKPFADRLWARVARAGEDDCWLWTGSTTKGYGAFSVRGRQTYAHRASFMLAHGEIPAGYVVCHRCDVPLCVNPAHLFLGSHLDNARDAVAKGRNASGERCAQAKLRNADIPAIRARLCTGERHDLIAQDYGVSRATISLINTGATWKSA